MPVRLRTRIGLHHGSSQFYTFLNNPFSSKIPRSAQAKTLVFGMGTESSGSTKRPTCRKCSKPARVCLCNRFQTPALNNSVNVTILQHSLEKKHPLNSTRIATIGLKNVHVVMISDVSFQAQFFIWLLDSCCKIVRPVVKRNNHLFDEMTSRESETFAVDLDGQTERENGSEGREMCNNGTGLTGNLPFLMNNNSISELQSCSGGEVALRVSEDTAAINFTIGKNAVFSSFNHCWITPNSSEEIGLDQLLTSDIAVGDLRKGFIVKKFHKKPLEHEIEEFEITVPPGSVLLFPSEESVDVEAVNFEVKNLIVLDGTWAKAKRMYYENPWLRLLPHVRLNIDKLSLYGEVRNQPRAGYLSTIESIVYALKAVGEDCEGLNGLLDVFESMVGDQRRCQNERMIRDSEM